MNIQLNELQFFNILYRIVKAFPQTIQSDGSVSKEIKCKRLNTFAVLWDVAQLNTDNLEKDIRYKKKGLFFSRKWEDSGFNSSKIGFDYPVLGISDGIVTGKHPIIQQRY